MASVQRIRELVEPVVESMGYEFVGCEVVGSGRATVVRVFIDKTDGITADDCGKVSHQISGLFDVEEPYASTYHLEVSSPGVNRPLFLLADFERFKGEKADVTLSKAVNNQRHFVGTIENVLNESVILMVNEHTVEIPHSLIKKANLLVL